MNFKKREHENRSNSKFLNIEKNPIIKYKKSKFLINEGGGLGVVSEDNIRELPQSLKMLMKRNRIKYYKIFFIYFSRPPIIKF